MVNVHITWQDIQSCILSALMSDGLNLFIFIFIFSVLGCAFTCFPYTSLFKVGTQERCHVPIKNCVNGEIFGNFSHEYSTIVEEGITMVRKSYLRVYIVHSCV